jgi:hypothetical protein
MNPGEQTPADAGASVDQPGNTTGRDGFYSVLVRMPGAATALRLRPDGGLTRRRVHAVMLSRARAEQIAAQITADTAHPGVTARAVRL